MAATTHKRNEREMFGTMKPRVCRQHGYSISPSRSWFNSSSGSDGSGGGGGGSISGGGNKVGFEMILFGAADLRKHSRAYGVWDGVLTE